MAVNFIIERDPNAYFKLAALQSEIGQELLQKHNLPTLDFDTIVLVEGENIYSHSTAVLKIARKLSGAWPLLYGFIVIPTAIRDIIYTWISRNRYTWFGKRGACRVPTPELRARFLQD
jgi:predicted DCC family thiol-disulfide oxidoreductase YuxK